MKVVFNIEWFETGKDIDTQNEEGMQRASQMYHEGYREGELYYEDNEKGEEIRGYWSAIES